MKVPGRNLQKKFANMMDKMGSKLNILKKISVIYKYAYLSDKIDGLRIHSAKGFDKFLQI